MGFLHRRRVPGETQSIQFSNILYYIIQLQPLTDGIYFDNASDSLHINNS